MFGEVHTITEDHHSGETLKHLINQTI